MPTPAHQLALPTAPLLPALYYQARALSSGTLSYRIANTNGFAIDAARVAFIEFCLANPQYPNWISAWNNFFVLFPD